MRLKRRRRLQPLPRRLRYRMPRQHQLRRAAAQALACSKERRLERHQARPPAMASNRLNHHCPANRRAPRIRKRSALLPTLIQLLRIRRTGLPQSRLIHPYSPNTTHLPRGLRRLPANTQPLDRNLVSTIALAATVDLAVEDAEAEIAEENSVVEADAIAEVVRTAA